MGVWYNWWLIEAMFWYDKQNYVKSRCRKNVILSLSVLYEVEVGKTQWLTSKFNMADEKLLKLLNQTNNYSIKHIL